MERYGWSNVDKYVEKRLCRWGRLATIEADALILLNTYRSVAPRNADV